MSNQEYNDFFWQQLEMYRRRLLNLSLRNPLLNYRHRAHNLRVVDTTPDLFLEAVEGGTATLAGLPRMPNEPPDEQTPEFQLALDAARMTDEEHVKARAELERANSDLEGEEERLEAELRERVRKQLGLPPRRQASHLPLDEWARQNGINPNYDLPHNRHALAKIGSKRIVRTLLLPDPLERAANSVRRKANSNMQEMGINTLYALIGFLEWYESEDSDKVIQSPLLLYPMEIRRDRKRSSVRYGLSSLGEEPETNYTLVERFEQMGVGLPSYDEKASPGEYLTEVTEVARNYPRWHVRRFITIANVSSSRTVLYRDLDPEKNPSIGKQPIVWDLLVGRESDAPRLAEVYDVDSKSIARDLTSLIYDADSSQLSAIKDVLDGKNLVIKGPPGTGKSQTITNIIAAVLARGKSVLFVAEKMAALEVVRNRLDQAGLGKFCLELHSTKAKRSDVLSSLRERLEMTPSFRQDGFLEQKRQELSRYREQLNNYAQIINSQHGALNATIHQLLWRLQKYREAPLPPTFHRYHLDDLLTLTEIDVGRAEKVLEVFGEASSRIREAFGSLENHPWYGFSIPSPNPFVQRNLTTSMQNLMRNIEEIRSITSLAASERLSADLPDLETVRSFLNTPPLPKPPSNIRGQWIQRLYDADTRAEAQAFVKDAQSYRATRTEFDRFFVEPANPNESRSKLAELSRRISAIGISNAKVGDLGLVEADFKRELKAAQSQADALGHLGSLVEVSGTVSPAVVAARFLSAHALIRTTPREVLIARSPDVIEEGSEVILREALELKEDLEAYFDRWGAPLAELDPLAARTVVLDAANALRNAGAFSFLSKAVRRARAFHAKCFPGSERPTRAEMARELDELSAKLQAMARFAIDSSFARVAGGRYRGIQTDFATLLNAAEFAKVVRREFSPTEEPDCALRTLLLKSPMGDLDNFMHVCEREKSALETIAKSDNDTLLEKRVEERQERIDDLKQIRSAVEQLNLWRSTSLSELSQLVELIDKLTDYRNRAMTNQTAALLLGEDLANLDGDTSELEIHLKFIEDLIQMKLDAAAWTILASEDRDMRIDRRNQLQEQLRRAYKDFREAYNRINEPGKVNEERFFGDALPRVPLETIEARIKRSLEDSDSLQSLMQFETARAEASEVPQITSLLQQGASPEDLVGRFEYLVLELLVADAFDKYDVLSRFIKHAHEQKRRGFCKLDREIIRLDRGDLANRLLRRQVPIGRSSGRVGDFTERSAIEHHVNLRKPRITIRRLLQKAGYATQQLKPCFLMSPLSVGQYLDSRHISFDLVIIDEASQMLPEDALSAICRGKQLIVVGDPEQLPPTTFFAFGRDKEEGDEIEDGPPAESILELASTRYKPMRELLWHYRSRHESLIAFSNKHFYGDRLIIFPGPLKPDEVHGIRHVFVEGSYQPGVKLNLPEAQRLVDEARDFMRQHPELSLGIATMNLATADYIQQRLDALSEEDGIVRKYIERWEGTLESFFIKNLENVQGDERDAIFITTVYGPDRNGVVHQRFGPINSQAGYRRLNVLFTRAKQHVRLFTSLRPQDIRSTDQSHRGVHVLHDYLEYAATGSLEVGELTGREPDSDFERFVVKRLRNAGYKASCQVGVAGYRIDIGVHHPHDPRRFILGIECDGATYHSARSARDRDRIRQQILEDLGWTIHRIWSTDWFADSDKPFNRLLDRLKELVEETSLARTTNIDLRDTGNSNEESSAEFDPTRESVIADEVDGDEAAHAGVLAVRVGNRVTFAYVDDLFEEFTVVIGENRGGWTDRIVTPETPVARGLLGAKKDEVVTIQLPEGEKEAVVKRIDRVEL